MSTLSLEVAVGAGQGQGAGQGLPSSFPESGCPVLTMKRLRRPMRSCHANGCYAFMSYVRATSVVHLMRYEQPVFGCAKRDRLEAAQGLGDGNLCWEPFHAGSAEETNYAVCM